MPCPKSEPLFLSNPAHLMARGSPPISMETKVDHDDAETPPSPDGISRRSLKRGPLTAVACEACRKRKSKCDGVRPICSTCQSKDLARCVYEAGADGSRIKQLRKHNQNLQDEVASLQTRLNESWAENSHFTKRRKEHDASSEKSPTSPTSEHASAPPEYPSPYSSIDLETRFQQIRAGERGQRALSQYRLQGFLNEGFDPRSGWSGLQFNFPVDQRQHIDNVPFYSHPTPPLAQGDDSPISKVYSSFREYARQAIADGEPEIRVLGSFEVNSGVVFSNSNFENASYLSQWAGQVVSAWGLQSLAPKIGMMYLVFKLMRWQVSASQQDFDDLPATMKPTSTQILVQHPAFIDFIIWPLLRDLFITESQNYEPIQYTEKIAQTLNLTRDFTFEEILYGEPSTGHFRMQEAFRLYVENIDHWTIDPMLADQLPQLRGKVQLR